MHTAYFLPMAAVVFCSDVIPVLGTLEVIHCSLSPPGLLCLMQWESLAGLLSDGLLFCSEEIYSEWAASKGVGMCCCQNIRPAVHCNRFGSRLLKSLLVHSLHSYTCKKCAVITHIRASSVDVPTDVRNSLPRHTQGGASSNICCT